MGTLFNVLKVVIFEASAAILLSTLSATLTAIPVYFLWNWLMPTIFGLTKLTFAQSWGICILFGLLFNNTVKIKEER